MEFSYLIEASNSMVNTIKYIDNDTRIDKESLLLFMSIGCKNLTFLKNDQNLHDLIRRSASIYDELKGRIKENIEDIENFISAFGKIDTGILTESGMKKKVARYLMRDVQEIRKILRTEIQESLEGFEYRLEELCYTVCNEAERLSDNQKTKNLLDRCIKAVGGATMVAVNFTTDILAFPVVSHLSAGYGTHLLIKAVRNE
jgi:hypothetical protein